MTTCLAQTQQRFECLQHTPTRCQTLHNLLTCGSANSLVDLLFIFREEAMEHNVGAWRQLRSDLVLASTQYERPQTLSQACRGVCLPGSDGLGVALLKMLSSSQEPRIEEMHQAPQFVETILYRGTAQYQTPPCLYTIGCSRHLTVRIFDDLGFVQHHRLPHLVGQGGRIETEDGIGRQNDVSSAIELPLGAVVDGVTQPRPKTAYLFGPVV